MNRLIPSAFWLCFACVALSLAWLFPNHYPPWLAFHAEAWSALVIGIVGLWAASRLRVASPISNVSLVLYAMSLVPIAQFAIGQIVSFGVAAICASYIFGLALAVQLGSAWNVNARHEVFDFLFLAVTLASVCSVVLQLYQLLQFEFAGVWVMNVRPRTRFFGNLAQPNQLATLLLLGVLGSFWGYQRKVLAARIAFALCAFQLFGLALTGSRTGMLNVALIAGLLFLIYRSEPLYKTRGWIIVLALYFVACLWFVPILEGVLDQSMAGLSGRGLDAGTNPRWEIWRMFLTASALQPVFGFGWGQTPTANFAVAEQFSDQLGQFNSTHNIFLELIIWCGYPLAFIMIGLSLFAIYRTGKLLTNIELIAPILFVGVLLLHALFELPLHYAYFLFPFGLMLGALESSTRQTGSLKVRRRYSIIPILFGLVIWFIFVRDYRLIELHTYGLRFKTQHVESDLPFGPPPVWVLDQFSNYFVDVNNVPAGNLTPQELQRMTDSVNTTPSATTMYTLAANLALNGKLEEAIHWQRVLCKTMPAHCDAAKKLWHANNYPVMSGSNW